MNAVMHAAASGVRCVIQKFNASLLAYGFNQLLCNALNQRNDPKVGVTHFLLLHADVSPVQKDWLTIMLDEMERMDLGVLSVVIPIKNQQGLTSTGIDMTGNPPRPDIPWSVRRLTMTEVMELPETFTRVNLAKLPRCPRTPILLLNTGCMLIDIRRPFAEQIHFSIEDMITRDESGRFRPHVNPEDWNLSRQLHRLGVSYAATRKVVVEHVGTARYPNDQAWGDCETDPVFDQKG